MQGKVCLFRGLLAKQIGYSILLIWWKEKDIVQVDE